MSFLNPPAAQASVSLANANGEDTSRSIIDECKYIQHASAFKRQNRLIIVSNVKMGEDLSYLHKPVVVVDVYVFPSEMGLIVIYALSESQTGWSRLPSPAELNNTMESLFRAANVETFPQFCKPKVEVNFVFPLQ